MAAERSRLDVSVEIILSSSKSFPTSWVSIVVLIGNTCEILFEIFYLQISPSIIILMATHLSKILKPSSREGLTQGSLIISQSRRQQIEKASIFSQN